MESEKACSKCGKKYKVKSEQVFGVKDFLTINYCPECKEVQAIFPPLTAFKGKALRAINKKTGQVRIKGILPEEWANRDVIVEISGGVTPDNIEEYAEHADMISLGYLTHSIKAMDFSLEITEVLDKGS